MWGRKKRLILKLGDLSPELKEERYSEGFLRAVNPLGLEEGVEIGERCQEVMKKTRSFVPIKTGLTNLHRADLDFGTLHQSHFSPLCAVFWN